MVPALLAIALTAAPFPLPAVDGKPLAVTEGQKSFRLPMRFEKVRASYGKRQIDITESCGGWSRIAGHYAWRRPSSAASTRSPIRDMCAPSARSPSPMIEYVNTKSTNTTTSNRFDMNSPRSALIVDEERDISALRQTERAEHCARRSRRSRTLSRMTSRSVYEYPWFNGVRGIGWRAYETSPQGDGDCSEDQHGLDYGVCDDRLASAVPPRAVDLPSVIVRVRFCLWARIQETANRQRFEGIRVAVVVWSALFPREFSFKPVPTLANYDRHR
jgi:hypothetical protein